MLAKKHDFKLNIEPKIIRIQIYTGTKKPYLDVICVMFFFLIWTVSSTLAVLVFTLAQVNTTPMLCY